MANSQDLRTIGLLSLLGLLTLFSHVQASFPYYGTKIGALKRLHHGVSGDVYAVDSRTIFIKKFNYDGEAPAAYFYVGSSSRPSNNGGLRLRDERGGTTALTRRYRNKDITLSLPDGKTLRDFKWFSVWCDEFAVNFGDVSIPSNLDFPRPQKIAPLSGVHDVTSDNIVIVDAQTLLVPNFSYDGDAPDAKFWVGRGQRPSAHGLRIPDENGTENPLRRYDRKTIVLTLPGDLTIFDIGHFGVWCEAFTVDFGHVTVPEGLNVPPSLKMLGISPQSKLNCEVLYDDLAFEVRWAVAGESIVIQLVAKLADNEYMSFGISSSKDRSQMVGSDVVVAWVDKNTGKGYAQDYYLDDKSQCSGKRGSCPDVNIEDNTNSVRLLNAAMVNGYSIVTYQRSLQATDRLDLPIPINGSQAIVWAIGPLNQRRETSYHSQYTKTTHLIDFARQPSWNCPMPEGSKSNSDDSAEEEDDEEAVPEQKDTLVRGYPSGKPSTAASNVPEEEFYENRAQALQRSQESGNRRQETTSQSSGSVPTPKSVNSVGAWDIPAIQCYEPEDGVFYAQMGPTGGKHGYPAITGHVGWGISWYINGLLIPEIHVVRGKTYTFVVEGGNNPDIPAKYHPFYITDDPIGGYEHKLEEEKKGIRIFAGVHRSRSGQFTPIGVGRLCNWTPDVDGPPADDYQSFGAYQRTLTLKCDPGEPGVITWKPDQNTPDTVYYHCFTHRYLGWKIHVHDACEGHRYSSAASERHEVRVPLKTTAPTIEEDDDVVGASSIRHETKSQKTIGLSEFLRPPQNAPLFHPVKLPGRRPYLPGPIKKIVLPQQLPRPAVIVSHYRKPGPGQMTKPYNFKDNPHLIQPLAGSGTSGTVLLLGQPTELGNNHQRKSEPPPVSVPYGDSLPQDSLHTQVFATNSLPGKKDKKRPSKPLHAIKLAPINLPEKIKPLSLSIPVSTLTNDGSTIPPAVFKKPFDIHPVTEESSVLEIGSLKPAVNNGFKPDSVVIESGFRPIIRRDGSGPLIESPVDQVANRREDPGSEIDEVMETDTLFLTAQKGTQTQNFEPMFIPSPPDSSNTTIILRKVAPSAPPRLVTEKVLPVIAIHLPTAAKLQNPAINDFPDEDLMHNEEITLPNDYSEVQNENQKSNVEKNVEKLPEEEEIVKIIEIKNENLNHTETEIENEKKMYSNRTNINKKGTLQDELDQKNQKFHKEYSLDVLDEEAETDFENSELEEMDEFQDWGWSNEDKEAQAAERIDTYYLPPDNRKIPHANIPSGAVVTYDGKSVEDASLVLPPKLDSHESNSGGGRGSHNRGLSKIEQLVRNTPQFGPFRGEIPPPVSEFLSTDQQLRLGAVNVNPVTSSAQASSSSNSYVSSHLTPQQHAPSLPTRPKTTKLHIANNAT